MQELQVSVPAGGLEGAEVDDVLDPLAGAGAGEGVQKDHPVGLHLCFCLLRAQEIAVQALAELPFVEENLQILAVLPEKAPGAFPCFGALTDE